jgi:predicted anti-sigma-YlaC factor YlaD
MMGRVIPLNGDRHREVQTLLPWYVMAKLGEAERAQVETHLMECADCQAKLQSERRLAAEISDAPQPANALNVEHGWDLISRQVMEQAPRRAPNAARIVRLLHERFEAARSGLGGSGWLRWAVAAQFCLILVLGAQEWRRPQPATYKALGSAPAAAAANVVVVFRPETPEKDLRAILRSNNARLVGGPTAADAYLLHVPPAGRTATLVRLRKQAQVVLAEPVDSEASP